MLLPANHRQQVTPSGRLQIQQMSRRHDQGVYTCTANNYDGNSMTRSLYVHVLGNTFILTIFIYFRQTKITILLYFILTISGTDFPILHASFQLFYPFQILQ